MKGYDEQSWEYEQVLELVVDAMGNLNEMDLCELVNDMLIGEWRLDNGCFIVRLSNTVGMLKLKDNSNE